MIFQNIKGLVHDFDNAKGFGAFYPKNTQNSSMIHKNHIFSKKNNKNSSKTRLYLTNQVI